MYSQGIGVDMAEFRRISSWVSQKELSDHVAKVLYVLLDEDGDGRSVENILEHSRKDPTTSVERGSLKQFP